MFRATNVQGLVDRRVNINSSLPYCMVPVACAEGIQKPVWWDTSRRARQRKQNWGKRMWTGIQEIFRLTKSWEK